MELALPAPDQPEKKSRRSARTRHARSGSSLDRMTLLAHQLKGPLAVISALAQGLARRGHRMSTDEIRERGKKIWHASRHLDELITTIMNFTRANTGGSSLIERSSISRRCFTT